MGSSKDGPPVAGYYVVLRKTDQPLWQKKSMWKVTALRFPTVKTIIFLEFALWEKKVMRAWYGRLNKRQ